VPPSQVARIIGVSHGIQPAAAAVLILNAQSCYIRGSSKRSFHLSLSIVHGIITVALVPVLADNSQLAKCMFHCPLALSSLPLRQPWSLIEAFPPCPRALRKGPLNSEQHLGQGQSVPGNLVAGGSSPWQSLLVTVQGEVGVKEDTE
jgi:hypothetical protein